MPDFSVIQKCPEPSLIPTIPNVIKSISDCVAFCQKEETTRTEINAKRDCAVAIIKSRHEAFSHLVSCRFTERDRLFDRYFEIAEKALEAGNDEVLKDVLQSVLAVYGSEVTGGTDNIRNLLDFRHEENAT